MKIPNEQITKFLSFLFIVHSSSFIVLHSQTVVKFNYTGSITTFTVPSGVTQLTITCNGAQGGYNNTVTSPFVKTPGYGGLGATMKGIFSSKQNVKPDSVLSVLVGEFPGLTNSFPGGGGGSFVALGSNYTMATSLIIAGGGGGGFDSTGWGANADTVAGGDNPGINGYGAGNHGNSSSWCGGGGGGFLSSGDTDKGNGHKGCPYPGGYGFRQGGQGGCPPLCDSNLEQCGGFGGGACADYDNFCNVAAGAGGGYNGGSGMNDSINYIKNVFYGKGDAGGSYNIGTSQVNTAANWTGNGEIEIAYYPLCNNWQELPDTARFFTNGGGGAFIVTNSGGCPFTATCKCGWINNITISGDTVHYKVNSDTSCIARSCYIYIYDFNNVLQDSFKISQNGSPALPGNISGPLSVKVNGTYTYSIAPVAGATSYTWTLSSGIIQSGQGTNVIAATFNVSGSDTICVRPYGKCGGGYSTCTEIDVDSVCTLNSIISGTNLTCNGNCTHRVIFNYTGAITTFTVPGGVTQLTITANGAQGGWNSTYSGTGGKGASMTGVFNNSQHVKPGSVVSILVGQCPGNFTYFPGGGGGTFVALGGNYTNDTALIVAGGGGAGYGGAGDNAPITTNGDGPNAGHNGFGASSSSCGGGGGGFYSSGAADSVNGFPGGMGFHQGGAGGCADTVYKHTGEYQCGGFGGGTAADNANICTPYAGNGGGYSGGSGEAVYSNQFFGWAGGSFMGGIAQTELAGYWTGNGIVFIQYLLCTGGSASITPQGGVPPYTYNWSNGATTSDVSNLSTGTYSAVAMDTKGCIATNTVTISGPAVLSANPIILKNITCNNCSNGSVQASPSGGTAPYTYLWQPAGQTTSSITGLSAGIYTVTIVDNNGCTSSDSIFLQNPNCSNWKLSPDSVSLPFNQSIGSFIVTNSGGCNFTATAGCNWISNIKIYGDSVHYNVDSSCTARSCYIYIYDSNLVLQDSFMVNQAGSYNLSISATPNTIIVGDSSLLTASLGIPSTYSWSPSAYLINPNSDTTYAHPLVTTTYTVTVKSSCGTTTDTVTVFVYPCPVLSSPCPVSGPDSAIISKDEIYSINPEKNATSYVWSVTGGVIKSGQGTTQIDVVFGITGIAVVCVYAQDSCYQSPSCCKYDTVYGGCTFALSLKTTPWYCAADEGSAAAIVSGGTPPYYYSWSPGGQTSDAISGLTAGNYSIDVVDTAGCTATAATNVLNGSVSSFDVAFAVPDTISSSDSTYLSVTCKIPADSFSWSPAGSVTSPNSQYSFAHPDTTTTYVVSFKTVCGFYYDTVKVVVSSCANKYDEQICIVTVDTALNRNVIIWGRYNSPPGKGSYIVYRENTYSIFVPIDRQPLSALSQFIDTSANPSQGAYSYKIATDDSCGESALSSVNTNVFLSVTDSAKVNILTWTAYIGFTPLRYRIFRGYNIDSMNQIDSVPYYILSYRDTAPPPTCVYMVGTVDPNGQCTPTYAIRSLSDQSISFSNVVQTNSFLGIKKLTVGNGELKVVPNPNNGMFSLIVNRQSSFAYKSTVEIYNILGQQIYSQFSILNSQYPIDLRSKPSGIYFYRVVTENGEILGEGKIVIAK